MFLVKGTKTKWARPAVIGLIGLGLLIGLNWCFSEIAAVVHQVAINPNDAASGVHRVVDDGSLTMLAAKPDKADTPKESLSNTAPVPVATGRSDPFKPLVQEEKTASTTNILGPTAPKDPMMGLQYTGLVNSSHGPALAMVQLQDPLLGETTVIRRVGETLEIPGVGSATLAKVQPDKISLMLNGVSRWLPLQPVMDAPPAAAPGTPASLPTGVPSLPVINTAPLTR
jgi:hypothetical protein